MNALIRQGDVLFEKIDRLPPGAIRLDHRVVARGEATGHNHELAETGKLYQIGDLVFVVAPEPTQVIHPEHSPITLDGVYTVTPQREYMPEAIRRVMD